MDEFKIEEYPASVQQLADFAVSILNIDSGVEWSATIEVLRWDSQIILRQGDFTWALQYGAGDKFTYYLSQVLSVYSLWMRAEKEVKDASKA